MKKNKQQKLPSSWAVYWLESWDIEGFKDSQMISFHNYLATKNLAKKFAKIIDRLRQTGGSVAVREIKKYKSFKK